MDICLRRVFAMNLDGEFDGPVDIAIRGGVIERIGRDLPVSDLIDVDEFAGSWVMPGLFDCHAHLACFADDTLRYLQMPVTRWSLELAANARRLLEMGVTHVRDPGGADAGIRDGIASGAVPGPRVQVAISALSQTGGHSDGFLAGPGLEIDTGFLSSSYPGRPPYTADGVDGMRLAVRKVLRAGADWIKICTTGGLLSSGLDHPDVAEFTPEEIAVAVAEAQRKGKPVMAHAYGGEGLSNAVHGGVRSVEHGLRLTERQAAEMAERGCWLVPTLSVMYELARISHAGEFPATTAEKVLDIEPIIGEAVGIARAAGVSIAMGTDSLSQRANPREILHLHRAGLSPSEALLAATREGAELCGVADTHGSVAEGYVADVIVLDADPSDLSVFDGDEPAAAVLLAGEVVHRRG